MESERQRLLALREELERAGEALRAEMELVLKSRNPAAIRAMSDKLYEHHKRLSSYHIALEAFHERSGPIGNIDPGKPLRRSYGGGD